MTWGLRTTLGMLCIGALWAPASQAQPALDKLEQRLQNRDAEPANAEPGYLGIIADDTREPGQGVRVVEVVPDGPGAQGGLQVNDLLTAVDGQRITSMEVVKQAIESSRAGDALKFKVKRGSLIIETRVALGARPPAGGRRFEQFGEIPPGAMPRPEIVGDAAPRPRLLGVRTVPVTPDAQRFFGLPEARGALVSAVVVDSPASKAGIPPDAVIVEIDGAAVNTPADLAEAVAAAGSGREIDLGFYSRGELQHKKVLLADVDAVVAAREARKPTEIVTPPSTDKDASPDARLDKLERQLRAMEKRLDRIEGFLQRLSGPPPLGTPQRAPAAGALPANET